MIQENCSTFTCHQERHIQTLFRFSVDLALVVPESSPDTSLMNSFQEMVVELSWETVTRSLGSDEKTSPPTVNTDMSDHLNQDTCR